MRKTMPSSKDYCEDTQCSNILTGTSPGVYHTLACPQHVVEMVFKARLEQDQKAPQPTENPFLKAKC